MTTTVVQMTSLSSAVALSSIPAGAYAVHIQAETQNIRYRLDGTNPTASVGTILAAGDDILIEGVKLADVRLIEVTASAKVNLTYFS